MEWESNGVGGRKGHPKDMGDYGKRKKGEMGRRWRENRFESAPKEN